MLAQGTCTAWEEFLAFVHKKCSTVEFQNWFAQVEVIGEEESRIVLRVPNIFVQEYLLGNYAKELALFLPVDEKGRPNIEFCIKSEAENVSLFTSPLEEAPVQEETFSPQLNHNYTFENFIEGASNQFVKSAAMGVAMRPGKSYNPLFIHGGVGLGKTHLLHSIGHHIKASNRKLKLQCITTEEFINDLVEHLRSKKVDAMKKFYRTLDVLLIDDIQFLQNRLNFEDEFCMTFEALINAGKQIVITSDKPPSQLKLSERLVARMEWGLVANIGIPDLETRVAILQYKAEKKGLKIPSNVAFFIAEHVFNNVRQLEGAINRLIAYTGVTDGTVTQNVVETILSEMFQYIPQKKITIESILKSVSSLFGIRVQDLQKSSRKKEIAFPRQVAMYLAKELIGDSLVKIASSFGGKTHSTLLHSWKKIKKQLESDEMLRRQIHMTRKNLET
ncbi:MAG: chromosomal replication initiator protein DnaA [Chlamydiae bacterium RIFCSPHIGHO2_12_FULL_49_11]|nr:MAG: chromosomal replication initiator protein DnaA [Chlamydiae bacterium RIFCSPHIGHO2_12_FULL_49_11]